MSSKQRLARELLDTRRLALGHATTPQLSSSSIDGGGLGFRDPDGNDLGSIGVGDDGGFIIDYSGGPKPPKPSPPTVSADAGIFRIEWDGSFENAGDEGVLATSDADRVEIHASMDENFVPDRVESFGGAFATLDGGSFALGPLPEAGTYYFRLVARSKSAQFSEPSERVEQELAITSIDLAVTDAWLTGDAAQVTADGKNGIWRGPEAPTEDPDVPFKDGDIWFEMTEDGKSIPNIWDDTLGEWVGNDDFRQSEIERVQTELREDLDSIVVDGSGTKNFYRDTMPTDEESSEGDLWFNSSDKNKPYIYQDGEWITVASSFATPGAGEALSTLVDGVSLSKAVTSDAEFAEDASKDGRWTYDGAVTTGDLTFAIPAVGGVDSTTFDMTFDGTEATKVGLGLVADTTLYINSPGGTPVVESIFFVAGGSVPEPTVTADAAPVEVGDGGLSGATHHMEDLGELAKSLLTSYLAGGLVDQIAFGLRVTLPYAPGAWVDVSTLSVTQAVTGNGITDKAITTDKIAVGAITAESGIIGSINAGTITVGEMNGARIKAQTIAADKLLIGGIAPLNTNPEFSDGLTGWASTGSPTVSESVVTLPRSTSISSAALAVTPGQVLRVRAITSSVEASSPGVGLFVYNDTPADPTGRVFIGFNTGNTGQAPGSVIGDHRVTIPAGWTHVRIVAEKGNVGSPATVYSLGAYDAAGATLIQDGSISAEHIRVGAITAESGIIGSIDANVITVGKIMANQLDADAINGKTITGATIRTASSGSRVELTHNGLKQYNSLGATIVDMSAGAFNVFGGSITGSTIKTAESGSRVEITSQGLRQYDPTGSAALILENGVVEVRNALSLRDTGRVQLLGTSGGAGVGENVTMTMARDGFGRAGLAGRDRDSGNHIGTMAWEDGARRGLVLTGPTPNPGYDEYPMMFLSSSSAYFGMGGTDAYGSFQVSRASGGTTSIVGASVTVNVNTGSGRFQVPKVYDVTYSGGDRVHVNAQGTLFRYLSSSSLRYKQNIVPAEGKPSILDVVPVTWNYKEEVERAEAAKQYLAEHGDGPLPREFDMAELEPPRLYGAVAEDVHELGLTELVKYDFAGRPDSLDYEKFGVALIPVVRELRDRIEQLELQLASE